jgi:hypothetical protein
MKNYWTYLALVGILFLSCKKNNDVASNYLKANIDGQWVTFSEASFDATPDGSNPSQTNLLVYAGDQSNSIQVSIQTTAAIATGNTYTTVPTAEYNVNVNLYRDEATRMIYGSANPPSGEPSYYVVNITSFTENEIRGNITGNFLYADDGRSAHLTVGEFTAKRNNQ